MRTILPWLWLVVVAFAALLLARSAPRPRSHPRPLRAALSDRPAIPASTAHTRREEPRRDAQPAPSAAPQQSGVLTGQVLRRDGRPCAARVIARRDGEPFGREWRTEAGDDGRFRLALSAGYYNVCAETEADIALANPRPVQVPGDGSSVEVRLQLEAPCQVWGYVSDPAGRSFAGAVVVTDEEGDRVTSSECGEYHLRLVGDSRTIEARAPGFAPGFGHLDYSTEPMRVDLRLGAACSLAGRVTDKEGHAVPGAVVQASPNDDDYLGDKDAHTDSAGRYRIDDLRAGTHGIRVSAEGYLEYSDEIDVAGATTADFPLRRAARIEGRVLVRPHPPAKSWVSVSLLDAQHFSSQFNSCHAEAHEDGSFVITGVYPGRYVVDATTGDFQFGRSAELQVEEGETLTGVQVALRVFGRVQGVVRTASTGKPVRDACVMDVTLVGHHGELSADQFVGSADSFTDAEGRFTLVDMPPGRRDLLVLPPTQVETEVGVDVLEGGDSHLDITVEDGGAIVGVAPEGVKAVRVQRVDVMDFPRGWELDSSGCIESYDPLGLNRIGDRPATGRRIGPDGAFRVQGLAPGWYLCAGWWNDSGFYHPSHLVEVAGSAEVAWSPVKAVQRKVTGTVRCGGPSGMNRGLLHFDGRGDQAGVTSDVYPDDSGRYTAFLPSGTYSVVASWERPQVSRDPATGRPIVVHQGCTGILEVPEGTGDYSADIDLSLQ